MTTMATADIVIQPEKVFEQVVFSEILVPNTLNTFKDYMTPETVKRFAYEFARLGYGIDVGHDQIDVNGVKCYVVESFIARDSDPDFIPGSWVVGIKIIDPDLWAMVLDGSLNGFSFEADIFYHEATFTRSANRSIIGVTEPDLIDGHSHSFVVTVDKDGRVVTGGTGVTDGHSHSITKHTTTGTTDSHKHRYQIVEE